MKTVGRCFILSARYGRAMLQRLGMRTAWDVLQAAALVGMACFVVGMIWRHESCGPEELPDSTIPNGMRWQAAGMPPSPEVAPAVALGDPLRVQRLLRPGYTYVTRVKGGFRGESRPRDGARRPLRNTVYACEAVVRRTIESNDGVRVVEVRQFETVKMVILVSNAEMELELGPPGQPLLDAVGAGESIPGMRALPPEPVAQAILGPNAKEVLQDARAVAFMETDPLAGKRIRITHVEGQGIESVQPLGCDLTMLELRYLLGLPFLYDGQLVPPSKGVAPRAWHVRPETMAALLGPALRGVSWPEATIRPGPYDRLAVNPPLDLMALRVEGHGQAADATTSPQGSLWAEPGSGQIVKAQLRWPVDARSAPSFSVLLADTVVHNPSPFLASYFCFSRQSPQEAEPVAAPDDDLIWGLVTITGASLMLAVCGALLARGSSQRLCNTVAVVCVMFLLAFGSRIYGAVWLAQLLPVSNVIILANWLPLGAAFFAGVLVVQRVIPAWRRAAMITALTALAGYSAIGHLSLASDPTCRSWFREGVCLQTLPETCSPCSAVTLLHHYGIEADEAEMTQLCLTRRRGTSLLGLYRGLKLKTQGTPWDVEVVRCSPSELREYNQPVLLRVRPLALTALGPGDEGLLEKWTPDVEHSVVLLGFCSDGRAEIGDPANVLNPRAKWTVEDLENRWQGEGFRIVPRSPAAPLLSLQR